MLLIRDSITHTYVGYNHRESPHITQSLSVRAQTLLYSFLILINIYFESKVGVRNLEIDIKIMKYVSASVIPVKTDFVCSNYFVSFRT